MSKDGGELSVAQIEELSQALTELRGQLEEAVAATDEGAKPVDLDEPIGRVSRMDAMQQQEMTRASRSSLEHRLTRVQSALARLRRGEYGLCLECEEPIGYRRLAARPESSLCLACQRSREQRR